MMSTIIGVSSSDGTTAQSDYPKFRHHAGRHVVETMREGDVAIAVAAPLQKRDEVRFHGGYLRALIEKKREGNFSVGPILSARIFASSGTKPSDKTGVIQGRCGASVTGRP